MIKCITLFLLPVLFISLFIIIGGKAEEISGLLISFVIAFILAIVTAFVKHDIIHSKLPEWCPFSLEQINYGTAFFFVCGIIVDSIIITDIYITDIMSDNIIRDIANTILIIIYPLAIKIILPLITYVSWGERINDLSTRVNEDPVTSPNPLVNKIIKNTLLVPDFINELIVGGKQNAIINGVKISKTTYGRNFAISSQYLITKIMKDTSRANCETIVEDIMGFGSLIALNVNSCITYKDEEWDSLSLANALFVVALIWGISIGTACAKGEKNYRKYQKEYDSRRNTNIGGERFIFFCNNVALGIYLVRICLDDNNISEEDELPAALKIVYSSPEELYKLSLFDNNGYLNNLTGYKNFLKIINNIDKNKAPIDRRNSLKSALDNYHPWLSAICNKLKL